MTDLKKFPFAKTEGTSKPTDAGPPEQEKILSINDPIFEEISNQGKPKKPAKKTPRVMGKKEKKKEKKDKPSKFALQKSENSQSKEPDIDKPKDSFFDFSSATPSADHQLKDSVFDFSTASLSDHPKESGFDFSAAAQSEQQPEESVFSFIDDSAPAPTQNPQPDDQTSAFSFVNDSHLTPADQNQEAEAHASNTPFFLSEPQQDNQNDQQIPQDVKSEPEAHKSDEVFSDTPNDPSNSIVDRFKSLKTKVEKAAKEVSQSRDVIQSSNPTESTAAKALYENNRERLLSLLDQAIEITKEVPEMMKEREVTATNDIPELKKRKEDANKELIDLDVQQTRDKQQISEAKQNTKASINSLNRTYDIKLQSFNNKKSQYEQMMNQSLEPIAERLAEIEQQKSSQEKAIAELMQKIEEHKSIIADLDKEYNEKMELYEQTEAKFNSQREQITEEERQLQQQRAETDAKIKKIEAPYQTLIDAIDKREKQMTRIAHRTQKIEALLADCTRDIQQCSSAADIITKLCNRHDETLRTRLEAKSRIEQATARINDLTHDSQPQKDQIKTLQFKLDRATEVVSSNSERAAQLEAEKKTAISQKNFMAAKQITQQLKEVQDLLQTAQKTIDESQAKIAKIQNDNSQQSVLIKKTQEELDEAKYVLLENDFNYFESAIAVLDGLFELSPFGVKLLKPLQELMLSALNYIERPPKLDPNLIAAKIDQLNKELDEVVSQEDFEKADEIQEKINRLQSKLAHT